MIPSEGNGEEEKIVERLVIPTPRSYKISSADVG